MSRVESRPVVESIEHLDHQPACEAVDRYEPICGGANPATYIVRSLCCSQVRFFCSKCVALKANPSRRYHWTCTACGAALGVVPWLDTVTLHPLGGAR